MTGHRRTMDTTILYMGSGIKQRYFREQFNTEILFAGILVLVSVRLCENFGVRPKADQIT